MKTSFFQLGKPSYGPTLSCYRQKIMLQMKLSVQLIKQGQE